MCPSYMDEHIARTLPWGRADFLDDGYVALPPTHGHPPVMFSVNQAEATAIRDAFHQRGELSAVIELRRLFPGVTDNQQARECVRMIAGWRLSEPDQPRGDWRTGTS